jgi:hypothetical protein
VLHLKKNISQISFNFLSYGLIFYFISVNSFLFSQTCGTTNFPPSNECDWIRTKIVDKENPSGNATPSYEQINFVFDSFSKYMSGITINGGTILKLVITDDTSTVPVPKTGICDFKLCMSVNNIFQTTPPSDEWNTLDSYGTGNSAPKPPLEIFKIRVDNACHTPRNHGAWQYFENHNETKAIIDNSGSLSLSAGGACANASEANGVGSYLGQHFDKLYFNIDYQIVPRITGGALNFSPGIYQLSIKYCLTEDD